MRHGDTIKTRIAEANQQALQRIYNAEPVWIDVKRAIDVIPDMTEETILHAGPSIAFADMCFPQQNAVKGALIFEGLAKNLHEANELALSEEIVLAPCHEYSAVGSMCGITSASMFVNIIRDQTSGIETYTALYESPNRNNLIFGFFDDSIIDQLLWVENTLYPALEYAVTKIGGINTKRIIARALSMGDECHNRHWAATATLALELVPIWLDGGFDRKTAKAAIEFIARSEHFFLHLTMPSCKLIADAANGVEYSTIVTAIARNGVETGIRVSGLPDQWFTGPADTIEGLYLSGFGPEDAGRDIGDSAISETVGLGAFGMAAAPAMEILGGTIEKAISITLEMDKITVGNNPHFPLPALNGMGTPTGIDIRLVLEQGILPMMNTGIAHKDGLGQIGAGVARVPEVAFQKALRAFSDKYSS